MIFQIDKIDAIDNPDERDEYINRILGNLKPDDPPFLSYLLVNADVSNAVVQTMEALASGRYSFVWRIKKLRGEFGEEPKHGDVVVRVVPINRQRRNGDLVTPRDLTRAKQDGTYSNRYELRREYRLDEKGCFSCDYSDAVYFLKTWGYNKKTNSAITRHPEYSYEPVDLRDATKGQKKHVRYWRYAEMDSADYARLQVLTQEKKKEK